MEPDFDDLIEDYIQDAMDDDGPPDHFVHQPPTPDDDDDDEWEEQHAWVASKNNNHGSATASVLQSNITTSNPVRTPPEPRNEPKSDNDEMDDDDDEDQHHGTRTIREVYTSKRPNKDPFAFERYNNDCQWRRESVESPSGAMRAKHWKKSSTTSTSTTRDTTSRGNSSWSLSNLRNSNYKPTSHKKDMPFSLCHVPMKPTVIKLYSHYHPQPGDTSVSITCRNGARLYVKVNEPSHHPSSNRNTHSRSTSTTSLSSSNLLGVSMKEIMRRVQTTRRQHEHEQFEQAIHASLQRQEDDNDDDDDDDDEFGSPRVNRPTIVSPSSPLQDYRMWVDKYAPVSFAHLLSDQRTNRDVVRALRAWDPYVFHRDPPPSRPEWNPSNKWNQTDNSKKAAESQLDSKKKTTTTTSNQSSEDKRPDVNSRIILLSGPPGIGKSTLAHILARHVGYMPLEVNGSDDRSSQVLKERLVALESNRIDFHHPQSKANPDDTNLTTPSKRGDPPSNNSSRGSIVKGRPTCLILDEIDGVDAKGAIQTLVDIVKADIPTHNPSGNNNKTKKKQVSYLRRPVILICNNKYAPALRPILPYCRQFQLEAPTQTRLTARLRDCLQQEQLIVSGTSVLHQLGTMSCGDIRSCLHTLQFVASRARQQQQQQLTNETEEDASKLVDVSQALQETLSGGHKDLRNDIASTITTIFRKDKGQGGTSSPSVGRVLDAVQAFGDHSRVLDCLFLNILGVSYIDPTMEKCAAAHQWLSDADLYRHGVETHIPSAAGAIHLLCRVEQRPDLAFTTRAFSENHYQTEANHALLNKFAEGLSLLAASGRSNGSIGLAMETIPYALWVLSAGEGGSALHRAVTSYDLLNKGEVKSFEKHLDALNNLGLTYRAVHEGSGTDSNKQRGPKLTLDPPIDQLTQYEGLRLSQERTRRDIAESIKEILAQKVAHQNMRRSINTPEKTTRVSLTEVVPAKDSDLTARADPTSTGQQAPHSPSLKRSESDGQASDTPIKRHKVTAQNFLQIGARKAKESRAARNAARVGVLKSQKNKLSHTGSGVPLSQVLRLKYVKGFTEAVRTPCQLEDLR